MAISKIVKTVSAEHAALMRDNYIMIFNFDNKGHYYAKYRHRKNQRIITLSCDNKALTLKKNGKIIKIIKFR